MNRRDFLRDSLAAAFLSGGAAAPAPSAAQPRAAAAAAPWYRRAYRWGQTNITEKDPVQYDIAWWRSYWRRGLLQRASRLVRP